MANVFTKRNKHPRTTTLTDFSQKPFLSYGPPVLPRIISPTRRCNPHPTGLVIQQPYNRDNTTFDIWHPDFNKILKRMPAMTSHLERTNFSSGEFLPVIEKRGLPEIKYSVTSTSRISYQKRSIPQEFQHMVKTTRFGHRPNDGPARGIVPNALNPM